MKLVQIKPNQYVTTIPIQMVRAMNWKAGDTLKLEFNDKRELILKKVI